MNFKSLLSSDSDENTFPDYTTFPTTFEKYKWYKPLIIIIIGIIMYLVFQVILYLAFNVVYGQTLVDKILVGGYETLDSSDASVYFSYLSIAVFIPAIYIASKIVRDRPFSSYSSSRGGWNWKLYFKCLSVPLAVYIIFNLIGLVIDGPSKAKPSNLSLTAIVIGTILIPIQCIAEEYVFRGVLMQTFGSWFKIPILAIIIQAILFALGHSYNSIGVIAILVSGIVYGLLAWRANGLEPSSAIHSINNLMNFYIGILALGSASSTLSYVDFIVDISITIITGVALYYVGTKKGWFNEKTA